MHKFRILNFFFLLLCQSAPTLFALHFMRGLKFVGAYSGTDRLFLISIYTSRTWRFYTEIQPPQSMCNDRINLQLSQLESEPCWPHVPAYLPTMIWTGGGHTCGETETSIEYRQHKRCLHRASETCGQVRHTPLFLAYSETHEVYLSLPDSRCICPSILSYFLWFGYTTGVSPKTG
jgi:hypothetical protein